MNLHILDCTLRDGGYYNNWDFRPSLVDDYFKSMDDSGVNAVEIGFRFASKNKFVGAFGYCRDSFLSQLNLPKCKLGVMINASDAKDDFVVKSFSKSADSLVNFVRIATHCEEYDKTEKISTELKCLGYNVCLNLMQISLQPLESIAKIAHAISKWGTVSVLYFADSLGNLDDHSIPSIMDAIKSAWTGPIGAHCHDNKGLALSNSLCAMKNGATWIDSTILGMGRGAGNTKTEEILMELDGYNAEATFPIVLGGFSDLQNKYRWGPNLLYYLSAKFGVHPTYVQEMSTDVYDKINVLKSLHKMGSSRFSNDCLKIAIDGNVSSTGTFDAHNWVKNRDVLLIASGESVEIHNKALMNFIETKNPIVISLNTKTAMSKEFIDIYAVCHRARLITEIDQYELLNKKFLMPVGIFSDVEKNKLEKLDILNYGVHVKQNEFSSNRFDCVIPGLLVFPYVLASLMAGSPDRVFLAGFDGFSHPDRDNHIILDILHDYKSKYPALISLTECSYPVQQSSVYYYL